MMWSFRPVCGWSPEVSALCLFTGVLVCDVLSLGHRFLNQSHGVQDTLPQDMVPWHTAHLN